MDAIRRGNDEQKLDCDQKPATAAEPAETLPIVPQKQETNGSILD